MVLKWRLLRIENFSLSLPPNYIFEGYELMFIYYENKNVSFIDDIIRHGL